MSSKKMQPSGMERFVCPECLRNHGGANRCDGCEGTELVDLDSARQREAFVERLGRRVRRRRRKYVLVMEAMAVVVCAGLLFVAMTVARGLGGGAIEWAAKLAVIGVLAVAWKAIPVIYQRYLLDEAGLLLVQLQRDGDPADTAKNSS